jgi:hypothetical protein
MFVHLTFMRCADLRSGVPQLEVRGTGGVLKLRLWMWGVKTSFYSLFMLYCCNFEVFSITFFTSTLDLKHSKNTAVSIYISVSLYSI